MKRVAMITCTFPPYRGGIGNSVYNFAKDLSAMDTEVTVFTPAYDKQAVEEKGPRVIRLKPWIKYQNAGFIPQLFFCLGSFDVLHLHYPFFGGAEIVWLYKLLHPKAKLVVTYHQDSVLDKGWRKYIFSLYNIFFLPLIIRSADLVTCSSMDYVKNSNLTKYYLKNQGKYAELPLGIDTEFYCPQEKKSALLNELDFSRTDKIFLFVGAMSTTHGFKGVDILIKAAEKLKLNSFDFKVLLVGNGNLVQKLKSQIADSGLSDIVKIKTGATNEDLRDCYNLAYVSILPSINKSEVFGLALVEAMACGKPVIASNLPGVRTVVLDNIGGLLVDPGSVDDLADKLSWLLLNEDKASDFGLSNLSFARDKYDIKKIALQLKQLYQKILFIDYNKISTLELGKEFINRIFYRLPLLPKEAQLEITNRCNFSCKMCQRANLGVEYADMDFAMYERILDRVAAIKNLVLTGWGEPFLHPRIFDMIVDAKKRGHDVRLTTNASLLNNNCRQNIFLSGLDGITFSIDDVESSDDSFGHEVAKQMDNIVSFLSERKKNNFEVKVYFQTTYHLGGEDKIFKIIGLAKKLGVDRVRISRLDMRFNSELRRPSIAQEKKLVERLMGAENSRIGIDFLPYLALDGVLARVYHQLYPLMHRGGRFCLRTFDNIYINQAGEVTPCCSLPKLAMGNVREDGIEKIWQNQNFKKFRANQKIICGKCDVLSIRPLDLED